MTSSVSTLIPPLLGGGPPHVTPSRRDHTASVNVSAFTAKYLKMIPGNLLAEPTSSVPLPDRDSKKEAKIDRVPAQADEAHEPSAASIKHLRMFETIAPRVMVRLKSKTVEEKTTEIVMAADDCGRLHSTRATKLYELLVMVALAHHVAIRPDAKVTPNRLAVFLVVDELPLLLGMSRATVYRAFDDLEEGGLVAKQAWYTDSTVRCNQKSVTHSGQQASLTEPSSGKAARHKSKTAITTAAGSVVDVVLTPSKGTGARVTQDDLTNQNYRHLDADRKAGRTAWQWMKEIKEARQHSERLDAEANALPGDKLHSTKADKLRERAEGLRQSVPFTSNDYKINHILRWTLSIPNQNPVTLTVSAQQEAVYRLGDLSLATPQQRGDMIEERAQALCLITGDGQNNIGFWRWLLWRMVELEHSQPGTVDALSTTLLRLLADLQEWAETEITLSPLRKPGALFVARLKKSGWWEELKAIKAV